MPTPYKITMYETNFPDVNSRETLAVFTFEDGKVKGEFPGGDQAKGLFSQVIEPDTGKTVSIEDGERFMKALPRAFQMSTIVQVEIED